MFSLKSFRKLALSNNRLEALSDGVFAIVLTLLILDIRAPHAIVYSHSTLWNIIAGLAPKILSWLISFFVIMVFWVNHHHILSRARKCDYGLVWLNAFVLLAVSFIPFPTAFMGEYPDSPLAVTFFAAVLAVAGGITTILHWYVMRFLAEGPASEEFSFLTILLFGPGLYLLAIAVAWLNLEIAYGILLFIPFYFLLPKQR